jgi:hypothetical protein
MINLIGQRCSIQTIGYHPPINGVCMHMDVGMQTIGMREGTVLNVRLILMNDQEFYQMPPSMAEILSSPPSPPQGIPRAIGTRWDEI